MIVKKCEWISKIAKEAILTIGDDNFECVAFSYPCNMAVGDQLRSPLIAISVKKITNEKINLTPSIKRIDDNFSHELFAKLIDKKIN